LNFLLFSISDRTCSRAYIKNHHDQHAGSNILCSGCGLSIFIAVFTTSLGVKNSHLSQTNLLSANVSNASQTTSFSVLSKEKDCNSPTT